MTVQIILAILALVIVVKGLGVLMAASKRTKPSVKAGWLLLTLGGFIMATSPIFAPAVIPLGAICLMMTGEATLALSSRRAQA